MGDVESVAVIGVGRIGLCLGLVLEAAGYNVVGVDADPERVATLRACSVDGIEPDVAAMLGAARRLEVTTRLDDALARANTVFVMVGSNTVPGDTYAHDAVDRVFESLLARPRPAAVSLVLCTNVLPGYCDTWSAKLAAGGYRLSYCPEYVAQGRIVSDLREPDMIVIGEANPEEGERLVGIYRSMVKNVPVFHRMKPVEAELAKVGLNCLLTAKIAFANHLGDIVDAYGGDPATVLAAIGDDHRIGTDYLLYGHAFGGPCFARDNASLVHAAGVAGIEPHLEQAVMAANNDHLDYLVERFCRRNDPGEPVIATDVTYKPGVDIVDQSMQLAFYTALARRGYRVVVRASPGIIGRIAARFDNLFDYDLA